MPLERSLAADGTKEEEFLYLLTEGSDLLRAGNVAVARDYFERALLLEPGNEQALNLLGLALHRLEHFKEADSIFRDLIHNNPVEPSLRLNLAMVLLKTGDLEGARRELEVVIDLNPDHPRAASYMGLVHERREAYASAGLWYERAGNQKRAMQMKVRAEAALAGEPPRREADPSFLDGAAVVDDETERSQKHHREGAVAKEQEGHDEAPPPAPPTADEIGLKIELTDEHFSMPPVDVDYVLDNDDRGGEAPSNGEVDLMRLPLPDDASPDDEDDFASPTQEFTAEAIKLASLAANEHRNAREHASEAPRRRTTDLERPALEVPMPNDGDDELDLTFEDGDGSDSHKVLPANAFDDDEDPPAPHPFDAGNNFAARQDDEVVIGSERDDDHAFLDVDLSLDGDAEDSQEGDAAPADELDFGDDDNADEIASLGEDEPADPPATLDDDVDAPEEERAAAESKLSSGAEAAALMAARADAMRRPNAIPDEGSAQQARSASLGFTLDVETGKRGPAPHNATEESSGQRRQRSMAEFSRAHDAFAGSNTLERRHDGAMIVTVEEVAYLRTDLLVSLCGQFEVEPLNRRYRGRRTDSLFGGNQSPMVAIMGNGMAVFDPGDMDVTILDLANEELYLVEGALASFSAGLVWENGRLPSEGGPDLDIVHLRGTGSVVLGNRKKIFCHTVLPSAPVTLHVERLVGWNGQVVPYRGELPGLPQTAQKPPIVRFEGNGLVLGM